MKTLQAPSLGRYPLAILAGLAMAVSFPKIGIAGFAWVAPGLMLAAALGKTGPEVFRIGYVAALAHYLAMLYWLLLIPYRWHGIPLGPAAGWLALSAFLALFPATWVWIVTPRQRTRDSTATPQTTEESEAAKTRHVAHARALESSRAFPATWLERSAWAISGAAVWVAIEMLLARIFGGFPWDLLGVSQYRMLPLIQFTSITGVYGVSFLIVWVSLALLSGAVMLLRRPSTGSIWVAEVCLPILAGAILFNIGLRQLRTEPPAARSIKVSCVQPSIPQALIWDPSASTVRFQDLIRLSEQALTNQVDLLVWPEAAIPKLLRYDLETFHAVTNLAQRHHVWMIVGSDDAEPRPAPAGPDDADFFNSSFLVSPDGKLVERYKKRNLVIFGEYVPGWLPILKWFTPVQSGFTPGTRAARFHLTNLEVETAVLICFEDAFPHLARGDVTPATDFLVNITNDGWFDETAAQWQHAASAVFRAVENHLPLVRCSNNGLTCWVDPRGRIRDIFRDAQGTIYGPGFLSFELPLGPSGMKHELTFYTRHGNIFGWSCVAVACLVVGGKIVNWKSQRRSPKTAPEV